MLAFCATDEAIPKNCREDLQPEMRCHHFMALVKNQGERQMTLNGQLW